MTGAFDHSQHHAIERTLSASESSIGQARALVRDVLAQAEFRGDVDAAVLLTSEVMTNAVRHAATEVRVSCVALADGALVRVVDAAPSRSVRLRAGDDPLASSGRGMQLVDLLADTWGVDVGPSEKTVWFTVR